MLELIRMSSNMHGGRKPLETSVTEFFLQKREFTPRGTHKHYSITFSNT